MADNLNSINSNELNEHKWWLLERIRNSSRKVLAPVIAAGSISLWWLPAATIPATWAAVATVLTACSNDEPENPKDVVAPTVNVSQHNVDISWGKQVRISWNQLYIWDTLVASWTDNITKNCKVELSINWKTISSWTIVNEWWILTVKVTDEAGNTKTIDIKLTMNNQLISWLENLQNLSMQVDQEVNLLNWITFWNGASLVKVEIEMDWETTQITDPNHYTPQYPWTCTIILTVKDKNGNIVTERVNKNIQALEYQAMEINNIRPVDILPIIWQIEVWDKNAYNHIEHLRIAEATRIRDMMWKYWAGTHSPAEYQQLMNRLNTGMMWENPIWYDNYEAVWWELSSAPSNHAHAERFILNTLVNHANFKIFNRYSPNFWRDLYAFCKSDPTKINIVWISIWADANKAEYDKRHMEELEEYYKEKNLLVFQAWWNIGNKSDWTVINKVYQEDYSLPDAHSVYGLQSCAHNKNDNVLNIHLILTFGTDSDGDIDQTNEVSESSKFPVWFHNKVLFSGRAFPFRKDQNDKIRGETGKYATSFTNYVNVAVADLCFQMFAEVKDVDELLNMIRSSSTLRDHIKFNGEDQPLILMNPAWFFKKYCMPTNLPDQINTWDIIPLNKWYYKWVIFDIPWTEVKINWQWIAYNDVNKSIIKAQNPMNLEWRLNWNLCAKMWYKWKTINWKIIAVDDNWNGLNINKDISFSF